MRPPARAAALVMALLLAPGPRPAAALDLFARHQVTVHFATQDGKPMADAEVRVFAPGIPDRPALTGHADGSGKFEFAADQEGFWRAEARAGSEIARVMVRVGTGRQEPLSPFWVVGGLAVLLVLAFAYRVARGRGRRPPT